MAEKSLSELKENLEATLNDPGLALREAVLLVREYENRQRILDPLREYALEAASVEGVASRIREKEQELFLNKFVIAYDVLSEVKEPGLSLDKERGLPLEAALGATYAYAIRQVREGVDPGEVAFQVREALGSASLSQNYLRVTEEEVFKGIHRTLQEHRDVDPGALERLKPVVEALREELFRAPEAKEVKGPTPRVDDFGPSL